MPKRRVTRECLKQVQDALETYREEVEATNLGPSTKGTYLRHAETFVRWLDGNFDPGRRAPVSAICNPGEKLMCSLSPVLVSLEFQWRPLGRLQLGEDGRLKFPVAPGKPGLYRFRFVGGSDSRLYIGETDELRRRFQHYRTPGVRQQTNIRINEEFRRRMEAGGDIEVDIVHDRIAVSSAGAPVGVDLADKAVRRLLEHAALVSEAAAGAKLLNR